MHAPPSDSTIGQRSQVPPAPSLSPQTSPSQRPAGSGGGGPVSRTSISHVATVIVGISAVNETTYRPGSVIATGKRHRYGELSLTTSPPPTAARPPVTWRPIQGQPVAESVKLTQSSAPVSGALGENENRASQLAGEPVSGRPASRRPASRRPASRRPASRRPASPAPESLALASAPAAPPSSVAASIPPRPPSPPPSVPVQPQSTVTNSKRGVEAQRTGTSSRVRGSAIK